MNIDKTIKELEAAKPAELREFFSVAARAFAAKAETLYEKDPENNGLEAQPYADIADFCDDASMVFEADTGSVDARAETPEAQRLTVAAAVVAAKPKGNPWGNW